MRFRFAIIGAGLTGTSMLYQFIRRLERQARSGVVNPRWVKIRVLEKGPQAGPGFPHNEHFVRPYHITNMCAGEMSVMYSHPQDFSDWILARHSDLETQFPQFRMILRDPAYSRNDCTHYPRALMGEYLKARFQDALEIAKGLGTEVQVHTECEVTNITENERDLSLCAHLRGAVFRFRADRVLLATGHWPRSGSGCGYLSTPWPAQRLLEQIPLGTAVAVLGSSLSAIETALTLTSEGRFIRARSGDLVFQPPANPRRITLLSRHGLLPKVRQRSADYQPRFFNQEHLRDLLASHSRDLTLETLFHVLDQELGSAMGRPFDWRMVMSPNGSAMDLIKSGLDQGPSATSQCAGGWWQSILRQAFPVIRELYLALSGAERSRFEQEYATIFFSHAATQPRINAEKMLALMRSGLLQVVKLGHTYHFHQKPMDSPGYRFVYGEEESRVSDYGYVVDARGQERSVHTNSSQLIQNLLRHRMIHLGEIHYSEQDRNNLTTPPMDESQAVDTESVWIDPDSHRVIQVKREGGVSISDNLYAVGAMTRGQIIDVSTARGLTRSTDLIARHLVKMLAHNRNRDQPDADCAT